VTINAAFNAAAPRPAAALAATAAIGATFAAAAPRPAVAILARSTPSAVFSAFASRPSVAIGAAVPQAAPPARPSVPPDSTNERRHRQQLATAVNAIRKGQIDCTAVLTLQPGVASTVLMDGRISTWTHASLSPATASAAAEAAAGAMYWSTSTGMMTVHHSNSGVIDRTFSVSLMG
jgi:hypothetical protein